jgi:hypothetical protein
MSHQEETQSAGERPEPAPREDGAQSTQRAPLDAQGRERPRFLLDFPKNPDLELLIVAFESGNYAYIRDNAERVAAAATDPLVREAALELRRRIDPDPLAKYLLLISVLLLVFLSAWAYLSHGHR